MSAGATPEQHRRADDPEWAHVPVAADRPVVNGAETSTEELQAQIGAEAEVLQDERLQERERLREEVGATVGELAARLDVPARVRAGGQEFVERTRERSGTAVTAVERQVVERPAAVGAVAAGLLLVALALLRRARRRRRGATRLTPSPENAR